MAMKLRALSSASLSRSLYTSAFQRASNSISVFTAQCRHADGNIWRACSSVDSGPGMSEVARRHGVSEACAALAWTLRHPGVASIPKATNPDRRRRNRKAHDLVLSNEDLRPIDGDYPPRNGPVPLAIL